MMAGEMQVQDEDAPNHFAEDETTKFILSSCRNPQLPIAVHASGMELMEGQFKNGAKCDKSEPKVVHPVMEDRWVGQQDRNRKNSSQSKLGSAHIQLQMLVEDVKEEFEDFANGNNNNNNNSKTDCANSEKSLGNDVSIKGDKVKTVRTGWKRYIGIILGITSSMLFALCILIVKVLANEYHPYSVTFWRFQGVLLPSLPIAFYYRVIKKQPILDMLCPVNGPGNPKTIFFVVIRCLSGSSAVVLQFYSLQFISMADSSVIAFSTPVFVSLASHVLLGEKSGVIPVLCGVITLIGVAVITRPPLLTGGDEFDTNTLIGAGMALGCMFCATSTFLLLRYLRQIHFSVITVCFGVWGSLQSLALSASISSFQPPEGFEHWMLAIALASLTFLGQTCITLAFKFEQAGTVSLCRTFDILFAYVWQFIFLGVIPDMYSFVGGGIVILGVLIAAFRKFLTDLPAESPTKKTFWILLK